MQYEMLVSLGYNCQNRFTFDQFATIGPEFVLDGLVSHKLPKVIDLLENEFANFFLRNQIFVEKEDNGFFVVKDGLNDITSVHDFQNGMDFDLSYQAAMDRKIPQYTNLMREIKNNPGKLLFVRRNKAYETLDDIIRLRDVIAKLRMEKPFELYVFQNKEWMAEKWGVPNLFTFYDGRWVCDERMGWVGNKNLWQTVFKDVEFNHAFLGQSA